jgi:hypothetical protein
MVVGFLSHATVLVTCIQLRDAYQPVLDMADLELQLGCFWGAGSRRPILSIFLVPGPEVQLCLFNVLDPTLSRGTTKVTRYSKSTAS